jgi:hypothetical protein
MVQARAVAGSGISVVEPSDSATRESSDIAVMFTGSVMATLTTQLPPTTEFLSDDMKFNDGHRMSIITYSVLMVVSAMGNVTVLANILRRRRSLRFGNNYMFMHLAIADLLVSPRTSLFDLLTQRLQITYRES